MESRGMEERDRIKGFHYRQVFAQNYALYVFFAGITGNFCCLSQARQEFDAIDRPVRHFLDAGSNTRDVKQQESKGHEPGHPDDLAEDLLERHGHDALRQS